MRIIVPLVIGLILSSCSAEQKEVKACEDNLLSKLKAPATYKRVSLTDMLISNKTSRYQSVDITYDAENSFGTPLRDTEYCFYPVDKDGSIRTDLPGDVEEAVSGRGYFSPSAKMPTVEAHQKLLDDETNALMANYENGTDADLGEPDNLDAMVDTTSLSQTQPMAR